MKLLSRTYIEEDSVWEFKYHHYFRGVVQELIFRLPYNNPSPSTYNAWCAEGRDLAREHINDQIEEILKNNKLAQEKEKKDEKK